MEAESPTVTAVDDPELEQAAVRFFEAAHRGAAAGQKEVELVYGSAAFTLALPPLGEGDRGMVYRVRSHSLEVAEPHGELCLKVAKQQPICRERLLEETMTTDFFLSEGVAVPRIHHMDPIGRFCLKDFIEGESVTSLYLRFSQLSARTQGLILADLERVPRPPPRAVSEAPRLPGQHQPQQHLRAHPEGPVLRPGSVRAHRSGHDPEEELRRVHVREVLERGAPRPHPQVPADRIPAVAGAAGGHHVGARRGEGLRDLPRPQAVRGVPAAQGGAHARVRRRGSGPARGRRRRELLPRPRGRGGGAPRRVHQARLVEPPHRPRLGPGRDGVPAPRAALDDRRRRDALQAHRDRPGALQRADRGAPHRALQADPQHRRHPGRAPARPRPQPREAPRGARRPRRSPRERRHAGPRRSGAPIRR